MRTPERLKGQIREYKDNFILKGGLTGITRHIPGNIICCRLIAVATAGTALCAGLITALLEEAVSGLTRLLVS